MRFLTALFLAIAIIRVDIAYSVTPDWKFQEFNSCLEYDSRGGNYYLTIDPETQNENWWKQETPWQVRRMALEKESIPEKRKIVIIFRVDSYKPEKFYNYAVAGIICNQRRTRIALVSHPCPVLLCGEVPYSPVRTNTWPQSQVALAASLQKNFEVELLDLRSLSQPEEWRRQLNKEYLKPLNYGGLTLRRHLIGNYYDQIANCAADAYVLTANFTAESNSVAEAIKLIKRMHPEAVVLVGGRDASALERHAFYIDAGADFIGIGDCDVALPKFLTEMNVRSKSDSRLIYGGIPCDFRQEKFYFSLNGFDRYRYRESGGGPILDGILNERSFAAYFETSRGCVRECPYCTEAKTSRWIEPMQDVKTRIDQYVEAGCRLLMVSDDNLLLRKPSDLIDIFNYMRESKVAWEFPVGLEMQLLTDKQGLFQDKLFEALFWNNKSSDGSGFSGAHRLLLPLEDMLLRESNLKKLSRVQGQAVNIIDKLLDAHIPFLNVAIMIGDPRETASDRSRLESNLEELYGITKSSATRMNFSIFCTSPLPGTPFGREMAKAQRLAFSIEDAPELWTVATSVISGNEFSAVENTLYREKLLTRFKMAQGEGKVSPA